MPAVASNIFTVAQSLPTESGVTLSPCFPLHLNTCIVLFEFRFNSLKHSELNYPINTTIPIFFTRVMEHTVGANFTT